MNTISYHYCVRYRPVSNEFDTCPVLGALTSARNSVLSQRDAAADPAIIVGIYETRDEARAEEAFLRSVAMMRDGIEPDTREYW